MHAGSDRAVTAFKGLILALAALGLIATLLAAPHHFDGYPAVERNPSTVLPLE